MTYLDRALALKDQLITIRRDLHQHPELAFQEVCTAQCVAETLRALGIEYETGIARTGVVAHLGEGTPPIALRADMDALPILEANSVEYRSRNAGVMHACGHCRKSSRAFLDFGLSGFPPRDDLRTRTSPACSARRCCCARISSRAS